ncbi:MAG: hypothetical protein KDD73_10570 [Anaerolineales bacterium]|nr:hypothetical protein [Anaerolineales bacterium]MCB9128832.1 hypothetical protein [Ardenticatenales bacterium]MCB9171396.1 hypothetical protein [Ardenticatenales bacterium]
MSDPLAPQIFTSGSFTTLIRALTEDESAVVTALDQAPHEDANTIAQYERLRVRWRGKEGEDERHLLLKVLPELTWAEAFHPDMAAPSEVLMLESDLSEAIGEVVIDGALAAGRRFGPRPAWLLYDDLPAQTMDLSLDSEAVQWIAEESAAFHALYWNDGSVTARYPWIPRFDDWVPAHCQFLDQLLTDRAVNRYGQGALRFRPTLMSSLQHFWRAARREQRRVLRTVLEQPDRLLDAILAGPQTIINGDWRSVQMVRWNDHLVVHEWGYLQYGPPMWDLCTFLAASPELVEPDFFLDSYFEALAALRPTFSLAERETLMRSFDLVRVLDLILHPNRWHVLESYTPEAVQAWLTDMCGDLERFIG